MKRAYFRDDLFLSVKRTISHPFLSILLVLILLFSIHLLGLVFFCREAGSYGYRALDQCFYRGRDGCIIMESFPKAYYDFGDPRNGEVIESIGEAVLDLPQIRGIGQYEWVTYGNVSFNPDLSDPSYRQIFEIAGSETEGNYVSTVHYVDANSPDPEADNNVLETALCYHSTWDILNLKLDEGKEPKEFENTRGQDLLMYLGSDYDSIPIGVEYSLRQSPDVHMIVAGRLEKDSCIFDMDSIFLSGESYHYKINMDHKAIVILPKGKYIGSSLCLVSVEEGYTIQEGKQAIADRMTEMGYPLFHQMPLSERAKGMFRFFLMIDDTLGGMAIPSSAMVVFCLLATHFLLSRLQSSEYAKYFVCGFSETRLARVLLIENLFRFLIAVGIGMGVNYLEVRYILRFHPDSLKEMMGVFFTRSVPLTIIVSLMFLLVSVLIPLLSLYRYGRAQLVKGDWR